MYKDPGGGGDLTSLLWNNFKLGGEEGNIKVLGEKIVLKKGNGKIYPLPFNIKAVWNEIK